MITDGELNEFLRLDEANVEESRRFYWGEHREIGEAIDSAWSLFDTIRRAAGQYATDDADQAEITRIANEIGVHGDELERIAASDGAPTGVSAEALASLRGARDRVWSRRLRGLLILYCHRQQAWALGALLRRHLTPTLGYVRVEAEAAALAYLMSRDAALARRWINVGGGPEGKQFFRGTQPDVVSVLARFGLTAAYESGSASSQHARFLGVVGSFSMKSFEERGRAIQEISLGFHEGAEEGEHMRFLHPLSFLRQQERIAWLLLESFPEVDDSIVRDQHHPRFRVRVDALFERFSRTFPDFVARARAPRETPS